MPRSPRLLTRRARLVLPLAVILGALVAWAASPVTVAAGTTTIMATGCSGANVRTSTSTSATRKASLTAGVMVSVEASVKGGKWTATCAGKTVSGTTWYRISAVNGVSVKSTYGVPYVYGATGLFKAATLPRIAACSKVNLLTAAKPTATRKTTLSSGASVSVVAVVDGGAFKATCAGKAVSTRRWYRISAIGSTSVKSRYRVTHLYAPIVMFKAPPTPAKTPDPSPTPGTPGTPPGMTEGIDVSSWQGTIDWPTVAAAGKRFVFMKATESTDYVDPPYAVNKAGATAAGLLVGAYHFAQPDKTPGDAVAEADHFLAVAPPSSGDLPPVLDLEVTGGLTTTQLQAWVRDYLERIYEQTGVHGMIYMSPAFWRNKMGDTTWFADNGYSVLWIAHWTTAAQPDVPANAWDGNGWTFWQYTSSGHVPGISGRVDLDRFNGTDFSAVRVH